MIIIAFRTLKEFGEKPDYAGSESSLHSWYHEAKSSSWKNSNELKQSYKNARIVGEGSEVFNIIGNIYRLVVSIDYDYQVIFIRFIGTHKEYDNIDVKWSAKKDSIEGDELDLLCTLVESYKMHHYPIAAPDPVDAIEFRMKQLGMTKTDLAKYLGAQSRVSEVLSRKRKLTLKMIKSLYNGLKIPADSLLNDSKEMPKHST